LPKEGRALYVAAGTVAMHGFHERAAKSWSSCASTRAKRTWNSRGRRPPRERAHAVPTLKSLLRYLFQMSASTFVLGNASMVPPTRLAEDGFRTCTSHCVGGTVAWWMPTSSSFGEFFSIFWEALLNADLEDHGVNVEHLISELPTISDVEKLAEEEGTRRRAIMDDDRRV
jgi:hypothetical protein